MSVLVFNLLGGIGLFLIGMMLLSDGLIAFAGGALRRALLRFTGTPIKAFMSGALATVVIQSSTATTVTLIGFVSAGLISFQQAIGVVIGASLGTTATGWMVAGVGLKVNLGFYTLPLIGIGAFLKLLGRGRWRDMGMACAGFGLLFLGLGTMQDGMQGLAGIVNLSGLPDGGLWGPMAAMAIGIVMTTVLQSSTAAVATTLTALHAGAVNFEQAAALVVGAAIGTTLTGALVTIGGTIAAKRTALAHILFNLATGLFAIVLLPVFLKIIGLLRQYFDLGAGATSLAAFHTMFIAVGVILLLPQTRRFEQVIGRILPERPEDLARHLDATLLTVPSVALEASKRALEDIALKLFEILDNLRGGPLDDRRRESLLSARVTLEQAYEFISRIRITDADNRLISQRVAQLHAVDHLLRLCARLQYPVLVEHDIPPDYQEAQVRSREILGLARAGVAGEAPSDWLAQIGEKIMDLRHLAREVRHDLLRDSGNHADASNALRTTDAFRWLERASGHVERICHYLAAGAFEPVGQAVPPV